MKNHNENSNDTMRNAGSVHNGVTEESLLQGCDILFDFSAFQNESCPEAIDNLLGGHLSHGNEPIDHNTLHVSADSSQIIQSPRLGLSLQRTYIAKSGESLRPASLPVQRDKLRKILQLLKSYHRSIHLSIPSSASKTSGARSKASSASTTNTYTTAIFSQADGSPHAEPEGRGRSEEENRRRAFLRALKTCPPCRKSKVKCHIEHHMLEELQTVTREASDLRMIEWAIRTNGSAETTSEQLEKLPEADHTLPYLAGARQTLPKASSSILLAVDAMIGSPVRSNKDASTSSHMSKDRTQSLMLPPPRRSLSNPTSQSATMPGRQDQHFITSQKRARQSSQLEMPIPQHLLTSRVYALDNPGDMLVIGERIDGHGGVSTYRCQGTLESDFSDCQLVFSSIDELQQHYETAHLSYHHIEDPLRLVCKGCNSFYGYNQTFCGSTQSVECRKALVERVYGRHLFPEDWFGLTAQDASINFSDLPFQSFATQGGFDEFSETYGSSSEVPESCYSFQGNPTSDDP